MSPSFSKAASTYGLLRYKPGLTNDKLSKNDPLAVNRYLWVSAIQTA